MDSTRCISLTSLWSGPEMHNLPQFLRDGFYTLIRTSGNLPPSHHVLLGPPFGSFFLKPSSILSFPSQWCHTNSSSIFFLCLFLYWTPPIFSGFQVLSTLPQKCSKFSRKIESPYRFMPFVIDDLIGALCPCSNQSGDNPKSTEALQRFPWEQLITCWPTLPILR